tara:strand:+ start:151 stop:1140 length:990 start_codon:yes stop_codon:yes gene_type:complete
MNKYLSKQYISLYDPLDLHTSFLGEYKKDLTKKFNKSLSSKNINDTILYSIDLHLCGSFDTVLSKLSNFYINDINTTCPRGLYFLNNFSKYYYGKYDYKFRKKHLLTIINDQVVRNFLCFFSTLVLSYHQNKLPKLPKIDHGDFNMANKKNTLISTNLNIVSRFIHKNDPKNIIIPLSEICNYLKEKPHNAVQNIVYWIGWLFEYEKVFHKGNLIVNLRNVKNIDNKYQNDFVWILWDILKYYSNDENKELINTLFNLFSINFTRGSKKGRSNIIVYAVLIIINPIPKIRYPLEYIPNEIYSKCAINSLKSNEMYLKLLQKKAIKETIN